MKKIKKNGVIHPTMTGYDFTVDKPLTPYPGGRKKCLECCNGSPKEVAQCHLWDCFNWPRRMGHGICTEPIGYAKMLEIHEETGEPFKFDPDGEPYLESLRNASSTKTPLPDTVSPENGQPEGSW